MSEFESATRAVFDAIHRQQAEDELLFQRLLSLISPQYFGVSEDAFRGKQVLDAGCGSNANASFAFLTLGAERVVSLDLGDAWMDCARGKLARFGDRSLLVSGNVLEFNFPDSSFDFVHCAGVLHHTRDPSRGFFELARVTRPGGYTFVTLMANAKGILYQWVNLLRLRYQENPEFRAVIDGLDAAAIHRDIDWIMDVREREEESVPAERAFLHSLFDDDFVLGMKDRLQAPTYHGFDFTEEQIRGWFAAVGLTDVRRLTRYPRGFRNLRRFLSPLYNDYRHPMAQLLFGEGYIQMIGRRPFAAPAGAASGGEAAPTRERVLRRNVTAGGVVVNPSGEVAVVSQCGTSWSLPKGHVQEGEDFVAAARREIWEETGLAELALVEALGSYQRQGLREDGSEDPDELKEIHLFLFRAERHPLQPLDPANPEARWVPLEEVAAMLTHRRDRQFFARIASALRNL